MRLFQVFIRAPYEAAFGHPSSAIVRAPSAEDAIRVAVQAGEFSVRASPNDDARAGPMHLDAEEIELDGPSGVVYYTYTD